MVVGLGLETEWRQLAAQATSEILDRRQLLRPGCESDQDQMQVIRHQTVDRAKARLPVKHMQQLLPEEPMEFRRQPTRGPIRQREGPEDGTAPTVEMCR
jgi:hypothetical protein